VLIGYFALSKLPDVKYQHFFLILASVFFYGYFNPVYLFIIISSIVVNYAVAALMKRFGQLNVSGGGGGRPRLRTLKALLVIGIVFNVGMLCYFKYYDFFIENVNAVFHLSFTFRNILLPLGISFFTFQQLSYLIAVYQGQEKTDSFTAYCIFVLFFPQLVAGPIVLYGEMVPQFTDEKRRRFDADNLARGVYLFVIGLFKKIVIADTLSLFVDNGFGTSELSFAAAWITSLSYTLQIYFDFSGYSDMAVGLGKMFNIDLVPNFNSPYKSASVSEFWRRWHVTLGRALSTYLYRPLGGNRNGKLRTAVNLLVTFFISGLWHGAAWTFVVWGTLHGVLVALERLSGSILDKIPKVIRIAGTFLAVNFLWVLFRADSFAQALKVYAGMFDIRSAGISQLSDIVFDGLINFPAPVDILYILGLLTVLLTVVFTCKNSMEMSKEFTPRRKTMIFSAVLFCVSVLHLARETVFIYFNF
jgi:alginate O-acetyltransferase complex protein AlgI